MTDLPIAADTPCTHCGYNLQGLLPAGACPECGHPIEHSVHGDFLRFASAAWLRSLVRGLAFILWGILISIVFNLLGSFFFRDVPVVQRTVNFAGSLCSLYGIWLLTEPDPSGRTDPAGSTSVRQIARITLVVSALYRLADIVMVGVQLPLPAHLATVLTVVVGIVEVVGQSARLLLLAQLAARIPRFELQVRARFLAKAIPICYGFFYVLLTPVLLMPGLTRGNPLVTAAACGGAVMLIPLLVFSIADLVLMARTRTAIRDQLPIASSLTPS